MSAQPITLLARIAESSKGRLNPAAKSATAKIALQILGSNNAALANKALVINLPLQDIADPTAADQYPLESLVQITIAPYASPSASS